MNKIAEAQKYLKEMGVDGWLLYDFAHSNPPLYIFLDLPQDKAFRRRFFYWIPVVGPPVKLVHAIEPHTLDEWPGSKQVYSSWQSLHHALSSILKGKKKVAMEYSPNIPYVSRVDGGTVDLVRSFGVEVVSSCDFLPHFTAVLDDAQAQSHIRAGKVLDQVAAATWHWIAERLKGGQAITEYDVQQKIMNDFAENGMITDTAPVVSVNANTADPHYCPTQLHAKPVRKGDFILLDMWCKEAKERAIFADITRVGIAAAKSTPRQQEIFQIVRHAQKAATDFVIKRFREKRRVEGYEIDDVARHLIKQAGYGDQFLHRTGHNIGVDLHGSGAHIDNLEMHDVRPILPGTCFSIEPGIYLEGEFGIRLEYDLYIDKQREVHIVGGIQDEIVCLFK
jgi:Xaa-Pro aminopeptidase